MLLLLLLPGVALAVCPSCQQQCPCSSGQATPMPCIGYDTRYMAGSIDEAMFTFPNLVSGQQGKPLFDESIEQSAASTDAQSAQSGPMISIASIQSGPGSEEAPAKAVNRFVAPAADSPCVSQECMSCKLAIVNGFLDNSHQKENDSLWGTKVRLEMETGLSAGSCGSAENTPPPTTTRKPRNWESHQKKREEELMSVLSAYGRKKRAIPSMPGSPLPPNTGGTQGTSTNTTTSSSSQDVMDALLGVTTQIGCDYRRGSALSTNSGFSGLCNLCWQWRRLPEDYFPNYVNEVSCDTTDCGCLSGFGTCMPVTRVLNVLRNVGTKINPQWQQATIDTIAACECQVSMTSPLLSFIAK